MSFREIYEIFWEAYFVYIYPCKKQVYCFQPFGNIIFLDTNKNIFFFHRRMGEVDGK